MTTENIEFGRARQIANDQLDMDVKFLNTYTEEKKNKLFTLKVVETYNKIRDS